MGGRGEGRSINSHAASTPYLVSIDSVPRLRVGLILMIERHSLQGAFNHIQMSINDREVACELDASYNQELIKGL